MLMIDNILISDEVLENQFICALDKCKGACCYEGDFGAPLTLAEKTILENSFEDFRAFLSTESQNVIAKEGLYTYYRENKSWGTSLMPDGACVYMNRDENGIAVCGIEQAYKAGVCDFQKPISCHLYPIRIKENKNQGFIALNYDQWDICKAGCKLGQDQKMPLFRFVKAALIRRFGERFYEQLEAAFEDLKK